MLNHHKYVNVGTKKRDGSWVWTPVWMASVEMNNTFYLFSAGGAGKVKRVRNFPEIKVAPCTVSGKMTGEIVSATAWLEDNPSICVQAYEALRAKYGWQMIALDFFSRVSGNFNKRQLIGFSVEAAQTD